MTMAKRSLEESYEESSGGEKSAADQVSHLEGISLIPIKHDKASAKKVDNGNAKDEQSFNISIVPLNISKTNKIKESNETTVEQLKVAPAACPVVETTREIKALDYFNSIYDAKSEKYLTQSDVEEKLIEHGKNLTELKLGFFFDSRILVCVRKHCPNIEKLELELKGYTETHLHNAFSHMKNLKIAVIKNLENYLLNKCAESFPETIEEIQFASPSIYYYDDPVPLPAFEKFNSLRRLGLIKYNLGLESITQMLKQKTGLVELSLTRSMVLSSIGIIQNLTNLEFLNLDKTRPMTSDGFRVLKTLGTSMEKLCHLAVSSYPGVNDHGLAFLSLSKNIEILVINDMERGYQANFAEAIASFHKLKKLYCANNCNVTDHGIKLLLKNSPDLEYLDVFNTRITTKSLMFAAEFVTDRNSDIELTFVIDESKIMYYRDFINHPGLNIIAKSSLKVHGDI